MITFLKPKSLHHLVAVLAIGAACLSGAAVAAEAENGPAFPTAPLIDPNAASEEELAAIPGLSEAAVAAIIAERPFSTPSELHGAVGEFLDEESQKSVYEHMFVKVGLNSGSGADYQLIPSTMPARRLAREFQEYRPYDAIEQFRREMGKYVSEEEVAHLERYVTLD